ncbi:MAG: SGNH/GDSL hydrolase family protein [Parasporobacterium sp.]|nr:SGNH/GDSL hydrolase family protein [Parasporobacterium sp.]
MRQRNSGNPFFTILIMLASVVMIVVGIIVFIPFSQRTGSTQQTAQGIASVRDMEARDISAVDSELRKQMASEETQDMDLWEKLNFYDTYIFGDSRCEPFFWSGLQVEHVFAEKSATVKYVGEHIDEIAAARPGNLVLSFGMNDMGMYAYDPANYWETGDDYVVAVDEYIRMIHEVSPDTNVYVNSIIPVLDFALDSQPRWAAVDEWNAALKAYCDESGNGYIDTTFIAYDYADLFDDDGVHFYSQTILDEWGEAILKAVEAKLY